MTITLNHTIVNATDKHASATFMTELLGLAPPVTYGPFVVVQIGDTSLDFADDHAPRGFQRQHYAFLVSEEEFDAIWGRIRVRGLTFWADPYHHAEGTINHHDGGRGLYWKDPDGHNLEIITVPYGGRP
ncbi:VOC family protein [Raineyella sp. W15-4]|uniref:VOC family protein n=1 Tax=Raineyella sp. W15-4 TaxID=3081651 RepID=UPI002952EEBF|nr:VOC family protein [Raineyella sp. W15-4]WOQ17825.1 VOC family protein [Raineyella sp. W15-4]